MGFPDLKLGEKKKSNSNKYPFSDLQLTLKHKWNWIRLRKQNWVGEVEEELISNMNGRGFFLSRLEKEDEAGDEYKPKKRKMVMLVEEGRREETRSFEWWLLEMKVNEWGRYEFEVENTWTLQEIWWRNDKH